jgi:uncharacterized protein
MTKPQGFASMTPEKRREIASMGGRAAFEKGVLYRFTKDTAASAGRKGGLARAANQAAKRRVG